MPNFSILLPPSSEKQSGGNPFAPDMFDYRTSNTFNYFNELNPERRRLISALHEAIENGQGLEEALRLKGAALEEALEIDSQIYDAPLMSALDRYSPGVMYRAMDFAGLPTGAQRRLLENGIIFSGLFGLLRPDDLIPNYHVPMEADLPGVGPVAEYWRPIISPVLNRTLEDALVWNMLPDPLNEAWDDDHTYRRMIRARFFRKKGGVREEITDHVLPLRGQLVNFIVRESLEELEPLYEWTHPEGFVLDRDGIAEDQDVGTVQLSFVKS